jgi:hypothetical protein
MTVVGRSESRPILNKLHKTSNHHFVKAFSNFLIIIPDPRVYLTIMSVGLGQSLKIMLAKMKIVFYSQNSLGLPN